MTIRVSRDTVACRLLDPALTDDDKTYIRAQIVRSAARHFDFADSIRLRELLEVAHSFSTAGGVGLMRRT
ncbi:MAG TPA: hypothetical protein VG273_16375 [Bryobacteraceae bacterium]|jgi:hypothetical protein|nr:hypothetical protein [Bryobacteraceae bacterium]